MLINLLQLWHSNLTNDSSGADGTLAAGAAHVAHSNVDCASCMLHIMSKGLHAEGQIQARAVKLP